MKHRARKFGRSKYGFSRFVKGFLDLLTVRFLTRYNQRPQHLMGVVGLILLSVGALVMVYLAAYWVVDHWMFGEDHPIGTRPLLIYATALLGVGTQLLCLGVLAELITSYNLRAEDTYSVAEAIGPERWRAAPPTARPPPTGRHPGPEPWPARRSLPSDDRQPEARRPDGDVRSRSPRRWSSAPDDPASRSRPRSPDAAGRRPDPHRRARSRLALGATLKQKAMIGANDISRWCTVWSLLERGTYAIDECPWQLGTQDKVLLPDPFPPEGQEPSKHFYSSKPPLLPTLIAGVLWPVRASDRRAAGRRRSSRSDRSGTRSRASTTSRPRTRRRSWRSTRSGAIGSST